jgi:hypothetical protein
MSLVITASHTRLFSPVKQTNKLSAFRELPIHVALRKKVPQEAIDLLTGATRQEYLSKNLHSECTLLKACQLCLWEEALVLLSCGGARGWSLPLAPSSSLVFLVRSTSSLTHSCPQYLHYIGFDEKDDRDQRIAIHYASYGCAPAAVLEALIAAYPDSVSAIDKVRYSL